jgi:hypothetical protein
LTKGKSAIARNIAGTTTTVHNSITFQSSLRVMVFPFNKKAIKFTTINVKEIRIRIIGIRKRIIGVTFPDCS